MTVRQDRAPDPAHDLVLFTYTFGEQQGTHGNSAPQCPSCRLRPAKWNPRKHQFNRYCGTNACENHRRLCHWCQQEYDRDSIGAGRKYCGDECKVRAYQVATGNSSRGRPRECARCGRRAISRNKTADICASCSGRYSSQIQKHHLDTVWALRLVEAKLCGYCGEQLRSYESGRHAGQIDHDHNCCPGAYSQCGRCVRGIICNRCNTTAAAIENDVDRTLAVLRHIWPGLADCYEATQPQAGTANRQQRRGMAEGAGASTGP